MTQIWPKQAFLLILLLFDPPISWSEGPFPLELNQEPPSNPELQPIKSIHFRDNYPSDRDNGWSDKLQGVANDGQHWFFTQEKKLWKFPVSHNLHFKVTKADPSKGISMVKIPATLADQGYNHFGDLDYSDGYLFIPLEGKMKYGLFDLKEKNLASKIVVFRASNLEYIGIFPLSSEQVKAGWCAIHPQTKKLYTSDISISEANPLFTYSFDWEQLRATTPPSTFSWASPPQRVSLFDTQGQKIITLKEYMQGGEFSQGGKELYLVNGKQGLDRDGGIWVFSGNDFRKIKKSHQDGDFAFEYKPERFQEPEGITIWSLPDGKAPGIPKSEAHVILLKKSETKWETVPLLGHPLPKPVKKWYFKHYEIFREANSEGLSDTDIAILISII